MNTLDEAIAVVFQMLPRARIALIDLDSCGVTALDWLLIMRCLRVHYDVIGGFARGLDESFDWLVPIAETRSFFSPSSMTALKMCDFGVLISNGAPTEYWQWKSTSRTEIFGVHAQRVITSVVRNGLANAGNDHS